jgi:hypothetical protein
LPKYATDYVVLKEEVRQIFLDGIGGVLNKQHKAYFPPFPFFIGAYKFSGVATAEEYVQELKSFHFGEMIFHRNDRRSKVAEHCKEVYAHFEYAHYYDAEEEVFRGINNMTELQICRQGSGSSSSSSPAREASLQKEREAAEALAREEQRLKEEARLQREAKEARLQQEAEDAGLQREAEDAMLQREAEEARLQREAEEARLQQEAEDARLQREAEDAMLQREAEDAMLQREAEKARLQKEAEDREQREESENQQRAEEEERRRKTEEELKAEEGLKTNEDAQAGGSDTQDMETDTSQAGVSGTQNVEADTSQVVQTPPIETEVHVIDLPIIPYTPSEDHTVSRWDEFVYYKKRKAVVLKSEERIKRLFQEDIVTRRETTVMQNTNKAPIAMASAAVSATKATKDNVVDIVREFESTKRRARMLQHTVANEQSYRDLVVNKYNRLSIDHKELSDKYRHLEEEKEHLAIQMMVLEA